MAPGREQLLEKHFNLENKRKKQGAGNRVVKPCDEPLADIVS